MRKFKTNPGIKYVQLEKTKEDGSLEIDQNKIVTPCSGVGQSLFVEDICRSEAAESEARLLLFTVNGEVNSN